MPWTFILVFCYIALLTGGAMYLIWRRLTHRQRVARALTEKVSQATDNILEDGVIEGPKGAYSSRKSWGEGSHGGTPRSSDGAGSSGFYGKS